MTIRLTNTLTRREEIFTPIDPAHVKMYVCGPTVYARPHLGNARSVVVYDMLYRLLRHQYGAVRYVRNITDVDDKINAAATERGITIQALTAEVTAQFHADMEALGVLRPDVEPKATEHIAQMIALIETLIARGFAYEAQGHVLFDVQRDKEYGVLSRRSVEDMLAGARVEVAPYKKYAGDFVLWKPVSDKDDPSSVFDSPWGKGRPGWHIECSAMSAAHLGREFDIHGGGADLMFPHHENEIAQSTCAHPGSQYARTWVHNGFLTVNGEKMSKSLGNFITVHDLLQRGVKGEVIRFALMSTRYNEPLDWTEKLLGDAQKVMDRMYRQSAESRVESRESSRKIPPLTSPPLSSLPPQAGGAGGGNVADSVEVATKVPPLTSPPQAGGIGEEAQAGGKEGGNVISNGGIPDPAILDALCDNLNTPKALAILQTLDGEALVASAQFMGLLQQSPQQWFQGAGEDTAWIEAEIAARAEAKKARDFAAADAIRAKLKARGIVLEDTPGGTSWRRESLS
jgi:cysteinyl-tRNA synthetase